jgi:hypothetical protein
MEMKAFRFIAGDHAPNRILPWRQVWKCPQPDGLLCAGQKSFENIVQIEAQMCCRRYNRLSGLAS